MAVLKVQKREGAGKYVAFEMRKEGMIPAVLYGKGEENVNLAVNEKELQEIVTSGARLIELDIDGAPQRALLKAAQHENIGERFIHADFRIVNDNTVLHVDVEINMVGVAKGIDLGGAVAQDLHKVRVACLPDALPEFVEIDVTEVVIGTVLYVKDLPAIEGVKYQTPAKIAVVSCHGMAAEEEDVEEEEAPEAAAE